MEDLSCLQILLKFLSNPEKVETDTSHLEENYIYQTVAQTVATAEKVEM